MRRAPIIVALCVFGILAACSNQTGENPVDAANDESEQLPSPDAPVSILRPDIEQPELADLPLEPLMVTIGFPNGGDELDAAAMAALEELLVSEQVIEGGSIVLRAHSDAGGGDAVNMRASQSRGDSVRNWLIAKGIDADRIEVIAFGEQNPLQPNALDNGQANEDGRAANRRVEIEVAVVGDGEPEPETTPLTPETD
ncbi:OmpA family protein [Erythrobacter crassostreae]|uniref:OmpA family protein n=1 Tax=Erythrobacter crassostreae TaxID=2828328 RepID=A0A9X1F1K3_9SPHN|nr:OmpA family protein [Erythrobacter crassostrea]MBV7258449.1 OmpA family protein [Erythrobacter crassostrea]